MSDKRQEIRCLLAVDTEAEAAYLQIAETIGAGEAVLQRIVESPVSGHGDVVLDFDRDGRLLGVEILDLRALPPMSGPDTEAGRRDTGA